MSKDFKLGFERETFTQFEQRHKKEREKAELEEQIREVQQHNAEIVDDINELQDLLRCGTLQLQKLQKKLKKLEG